MADRCPNCGRKYPAGGFRPGDVPVEPLREEYLRRDDLTPGEIARRLGWWKRPGVPNADRVRVQLGLRSYRSNGRRLTRQRVRYERAVELAEAMNMDPHEAGV
jgi:hypothetical protein